MVKNAICFIMSLLLLMLTAYLKIENKNIEKKCDNKFRYNINFAQFRSFDNN